MGCPRFVPKNGDGSFWKMTRRIYSRKQCAMKYGAILVLLLACSCATHRTSPDLGASVSRIRQYTKTFDGLGEEEARSRLSGAKLTETDWKEGGFEGKQLVATFPGYEVRVFLYTNSVVITSFQILSK